MATGTTGKPLPALPMVCYGVPAIAAVDTWAGACFMETQFFHDYVAKRLQLLELNPQVQECDPRTEVVVMGASGEEGHQNTVVPDGKVTISMRVGCCGPVHSQQFFLISGKSGPAVTLGQDWQDAQDVYVNVRRGIVVASQGLRIPLLTAEDAARWMDDNTTNEVAKLVQETRRKFFGTMMTAPGEYELEELSRGMSGLQLQPAQNEVHDLTQSMSGLQLQPMAVAAPKSATTEFGINEEWVAKRQALDPITPGKGVDFRRSPTPSL
jgi:hypothetical protein